MCGAVLRDRPSIEAGSPRRSKAGVSTANNAPLPEFGPREAGGGETERRDVWLGATRIAATFGDLA